MTKVIRKERLICVIASKDGIDKNHNKFYDISLLEDDSVYCIFGRVGGASQEVTYTSDNYKKKNKTGTEIFEDIYKEKTSDKKGYKPSRVVDASVGEGIKVARGNLLDIAIKQIRTNECAKAQEVLKTIVSNNIHNIAGNTNIKYDEKDGLFKTPLGVVTQDALDEAKLMLDRIKEEIDKKSSESVIRQLNADYFTLIPTKADFRRGVGLITSYDDITRQNNICDNLLDSLNVINSTQKSITQDVEHPKVFGVQIEYENDTAKAKKIIEYFENSKNRMHSHRNNNASIKNIFKMGIDIERERFDAKSKEIGEVHQLWHGTRLGNILSIFKGGLVMPKFSPSSKIGQMFSDGIYFASQSTKSLGYVDHNYWTAGSSSTSPYVYMFVADVAVGKYHVPRSSTSSRPPAGYHSYWAKPGQTSGIQNEEIIVFDLSQIRLSYLLEIKL